MTVTRVRPYSEPVNSLKTNCVSWLCDTFGLGWIEALIKLSNSRGQPSAASKHHDDLLVTFNPISDTTALVRARGSIWHR